MAAPNFELTDIHGEKTYTLDDFLGKPVLLTFWVSWCPDCNRDLEAKRALFEAMTTSALEIVMINVPGREADKKAGPAHYEEKKYPFLSLQDDGQKVYDKYQCMTVPTTVVLNKKGGIEAKFHDKASIQDMMPAISNAMM